MAGHRLECPHTEYGGSLKVSIDMLRIEAEEEATLHSNLAQRFLDEATKLNEFREKQKEERKKHEDIVHRTHKNKADLYRKMMSCKSSYESKCKSAEKADLDTEKLKFGNKPKEVEKARKNAAQCRSSALKADEDYKSSIGCVESARKLWINEHSEACEVFQQMEEERIKCLRNIIWECCNLVSDICCKLDNSREKVRQVTEKCDPGNDIREFVSKKSTCIAPLQPVEYEQFGSVPVQIEPAFSANVNGHVYDTEDDYSPTNSTGSMALHSSWKAIYDYIPSSPDEMELKKGDLITLTKTTTDNDGWFEGYNQRTKANGLLPQNYVEPHY
uniref:SH3 domain-containing protein n=1 Tax=Ciona savignyi TaxID=51511 RepID=H2ZN12_CIOSA